jgi:hypothetical protein
MPTVPLGTGNRELARVENLEIEPTHMSDCIILIVPPYHGPFLVSIICTLLDGVGDKVVRFGISAVK